MTNVCVCALYANEAVLCVCLMQIVLFIFYFGRSHTIKEHTEYDIRMNWHNRNMEYCTLNRNLLVSFSPSLCSVWKCMWKCVCWLTKHDDHMNWTAHMCILHIVLTPICRHFELALTQSEQSIRMDILRLLLFT